MKKNILIIIFFFLTGCATHQRDHFQESDIDFMFSTTEVKNIGYEYGEDPQLIINAVLNRSKELNIEVKGITALAWGMHPVVYIIFTDEKAIVNFFYFGITMGKGYLENYTLKELENMSLSVFSEKSCEKYSNHEIEWTDLHVFKKGNEYFVCEEGGAIFGGGKIRSYFGDNFDERIKWEMYRYGEEEL